ncbi:hypothetical protein HK102_004900 [Quaeritorhiza haematococci]|nr:hypothetical protein HK102_004900 [Quaeritorhiza haematococci]
MSAKINKLFATEAFPAFAPNASESTKLPTPRCPRLGLPRHQQSSNHSLATALAATSGRTSLFSTTFSLGSSSPLPSPSSSPVFSASNCANLSAIMEEEEEEELSLPSPVLSSSGYSFGSLSESQSASSSYSTSSRPSSALSFSRQSFLGTISEEEEDDF